MKKCPLPRKPSALIRLALNDLRAAERSKDYVVEMGTWHSPYRDQETGKVVCAVCMAGVVMAGTLKVPQTEAKSPDRMVDRDTQERLYALNSLREGDVAGALWRLDYSERTVKRAFNGMPMLEGCAVEHGEGEDPLYDQANIEDYAWNPGKFKRDMRRLANQFEKVGL